MKTINNFILLLLLMVSTSSCLKAGLDDLETYDQSEITNIRFEYRWWDETEKRLRVIEMNVDKNIDAKARKFLVQLPYLRLPMPLLPQSVRMYH